MNRRRWRALKHNQNEKLVRRLEMELDKIYKARRYIPATQVIHKIVFDPDFIDFRGDRIELEECLTFLKPMYAFRISDLSSYYSRQSFSIDEKTFNSMPERYSRYFRKSFLDEGRYYFKYSGELFVTRERVKANILTYRCEPDLESRYSYIRQVLYNNRLYYKYNHGKSGRRFWRVLRKGSRSENIRRAIMESKESDDDRSN
jgi:hypothetical protein